MDYQHYRIIDADHTMVSAARRAGTKICIPASWQRAKREMHPECDARVPYYTLLYILVVHSGDRIFVSAIFQY